MTNKQYERLELISDVADETKSSNENMLKISCLVADIINGN